MFRPLGYGVKVAAFRRDRIDRLAHYSMRRGIVGTSQFEDGCLQAGISEQVEFSLGWWIIDRVSVEAVKEQAGGLPIILVQMPRPPFGRSDGFGLEYMPKWERVQQAIDALKGKAFLIQIGAGQALLNFTNIDLDLANRTSICGLIDLSTISSGFIGNCSFIVPLAESQKKPALLVWSRKGMSSPHKVVRQMTPTKILHRPMTSHYVFDDCTDDELGKAADAFLEQVRSQGEL